MIHYFVGGGVRNDFYAGKKVPGCPWGFGTILGPVFDMGCFFNGEQGPPQDGDKILVC